MFLVQLPKPLFGYGVCPNDEVPTAFTGRRALGHSVTV
jgi:hypothetical protein